MIVNKISMAGDPPNIAFGRFRAYMQMAYTALWKFIMWEAGSLARRKMLLIVWMAPHDQTGGVVCPDEEFIRG